MRYAIIHAKERRIEEVMGTARDVPYAAAGLDGTRTDHGRALPRIGIIVDEHSMFAPAEQQAYYSIGYRLYGGNAVLYSFDMKGATRDFSADDRHHVESFLHFFNSVAEVEQAIDDGAIERPRNDMWGWEWPAPAPKELVP